MDVSNVEIDGKPAELLLPVGDVAGVAVFLHGYDDLTIAGNPAFEDALQQHAMACVCPRGFRCWWTDALTPSFDEIVSPVEFVRTAVVEWIAERFPEHSASLGIFGIEMGAQGALQVAYRSPRIFRVVAAISPKIDFDAWHGYGTALDQIFHSREEARQHTVTLQLNPLNVPARQLILCDPADRYCRDGVATLVSKLASSGVRHEADLEASHGGYGWDYANAMAARVTTFLARGLRRDDAG